VSEQELRVARVPKINKAIVRLIAAAEAYGDAKAAGEVALYAWKRGDPRLPTFDRKIEYELLSAARAVATSTRKKRAAPSPPGETR